MNQMECLALTGIYSQIIEELRKGTPRTIELTSAHNLISLSQVNPGTFLFLTSVDCEDLTMGDTGIIVEVITIAITMKSTVESGYGYHIMERERMSARCKLKFLANSTVRTSVTCCSLIEPRIVDVVRPVYFHAG